MQTRILHNYYYTKSIRKLGVRTLACTTEHAATVIIFIEYVHGIMHYNSHNKPDYNDMINTLSMNKVMQAHLGIISTSVMLLIIIIIMFINTYSYYIIPAMPDDIQRYATVTCIFATKNLSQKNHVEHNYLYILA